MAEKFAMATVIISNFEFYYRSVRKTAKRKHHIDSHSGIHTADVLTKFMMNISVISGLIHTKQKLDQDLMSLLAEQTIEGKIIFSL